MTVRPSITRPWTCTLAPLVSVLAACSAPSATSAPAPLANHQPETASETAGDKPAPASQSAPIHGRFVGDNIGYEIRHFGRPVAGKIQLPEGMERRSNTNYADGYRVVSAVADQALVIFLTDEEGVVLGDVTLPGLADAVVVPACEATEPDQRSYPQVLGVVRESACPSAEGSAPPAHAYDITKGQLKAIDRAVQCECFMVRDDEPIPWSAPLDRLTRAASSCVDTRRDTYGPPTCNSRRRP